MEKQAEAGKLTLADLNALADKGGEISKGVVVLIFGTGNPQEVALSFLDNDRLDESIVKKDAQGGIRAVTFFGRFEIIGSSGGGAEEVHLRI